MFQTIKFDIFQSRFPICRDSHAPRMPPVSAPFNLAIASHPHPVFRFRLSTYSAAARSVSPPSNVSIVFEETTLADLVEANGKTSEEDEDCEDEDCEEEDEADGGDVPDVRT